MFSLLFNFFSFSKNPFKNTDTNFLGPSFCVKLVKLVENSC
jgi:hypothetical protein